MKIRELSFIKKSDIKKLGKYADFTVTEFVDSIDKDLKSGKHIPKFYYELYKELLSVSKEKELDETEVLVEKKDETDYKKEDKTIQLKRIPLSNIQYYIDKKEYSKHYGALSRYDIHSLYDLVIATFSTKLKFELIGKKWQEYVITNSGKILSDWVDYTSIKSFPEEIERSSGLIQNFRRGLKDISLKLKGRIGDNRYPSAIKYPSSPDSPSSSEVVANILYMIYGENLTIEEVAEKLEYSTEHVRNINQKTITSLINGDVISENIRLNSDIIDWLKSVKNECLYKSERQLLEITGEKDERILSFLGYEFVEIIGKTGKRFVISKGTKGIYTKLSNAIISVLRDLVIPTDKEIIIEKVKNHHQFLKIDKDFEEDFIDNLLIYGELVENEDGKYFIKTNYLSTDEQRMARLIYEKKEPVINNVIKEEFQNLYNHPFKGGLSSLRKFGLKNIQGNLWAYGDNELPSIQSFVNEYAEKNKIFYYTDLEKELIKAGYIIPKSMRAYVTNVCYIDNKDRNHFCHKSYVDEFSENYNWRNQSRDGLTNWILNQIKDFLIEKGTVKIRQLINHIENEAKGTDYEEYIRQRVQSIVDNYCGDDYPFIVTGDSITKNPLSFDSTDFNIIGLKGSKYPFYSQIRSIILNSIKKSEDGRISLVDAINTVNESIAEPQNRKTIIHALTNKYLPSLDIELKNEGGNLYIVKIGDTISAEPIFEVVVSKTSETPGFIEDVKEVVETHLRPPVSYRIILDWEKLESALNRELSSYFTPMAGEGVNLEINIGKLISFLRNAENGNLNSRLPQSLYEYWFASTDYYDRTTYINNLLIYFEALLSEISFKKSGERSRAIGLGERIREFPDLQRALTTPPYLATTFEKIFQNLYKNRNICAHGDELIMTSAQTAKTIADYIALYIYVVAKYV